MGIAKWHLQEKSTILATVAELEHSKEKKMADSYEGQLTVAQADIKRKDEFILKLKKQCACDCGTDGCKKLCEEFDAALTSAQPAEVSPVTRVDPVVELVNRINEYLQLGGLFNPELMEHDKVRDLLMDFRKALSQTLRK